MPDSAVDAGVARPGESARQPRLFYGWYMIGAMVGIHWYFSAAFVYGFGVLFVPILDTFGWSRGVGSLTALFMQPVGGAVGPLAGYLVDRRGARPVVLAGVTCIGLGIMSLAFMQSLWMLFASFAVISLGMSSTLGVGFNTAIVTWFHRQRGKALGIGFSGGALSGPFVGVVVLLESSFGWRETAFALGLGMLIVGLPLAMLIRSRPSDVGLHPDGASDEEVAAAPAPAVGGMSSWEALRDRNFWVLAFIYGVLTMGITGFMLHQIPYFESIGFSRAQAASSLAFMTVLSLAGRLGVGWMMDAMTRRELDLRIVPAALLGLQAASFAVVANADSYAHVVLFAALFGLGFGGMIPSRPVLVGRLFGLPSFGTIQGLANFTAVPFAVSSPLLLGLVYDAQGEYLNGVLVLALLCAAAIPATYLLRVQGPDEPARRTDREREERPGAQPA